MHLLTQNIIKAFKFRAQAIFSLLEKTPPPYLHRLMELQTEKWGSVKNFSLAISTPAKVCVNSSVFRKDCIE
jgi:hypothetical protein